MTDKNLLTTFAIALFLLSTAFLSSCTLWTADTTKHTRVVNDTDYEISVVTTERDTILILPSQADTVDEVVGFQLHNSVTGFQFNQSILPVNDPDGYVTEILVE